MKTMHQYTLTITWTGNKGSGTSGYEAYDRSHVIHGENKPLIPGSSDPAFLDDPTRYNPEELLLASISSCHMLWYLHLCAQSGVIVLDYEDHAKGVMIESIGGGGHFEKVTLYPLVTVAEDSMKEPAQKIHKKANELCFIANSVSFPVLHEATCQIAS